MLQAVSRTKVHPLLSSNQIPIEMADKKPKATKKPSNRFSFKGDAPSDDEDEEGSSANANGGGDGVDGADPDDLETAWENLDLARVIFEKMIEEGKEVEGLEGTRMKLAEVHLNLADVALESGKLLAVFCRFLQDFQGEDDTDDVHIFQRHLSRVLPSTVRH